MPRKMNRVMIRVEDLGAKEGLRKLKIEIEGDQAQFETSDFCSREGVVAELQGLLKAAARETVVRYIESGGEILRSVKPREVQTKEPKKILNRVVVPSGVEH